jgi:hypothetical protein
MMGAKSFNRPHRWTFLWVLLAAAYAAPATAQIDMSGTWTAPVTMDNQEDATYGNSVGLPLNRAAQARIAAYDESMLALPEWQCRPHGAAYVMRSPQGRGFQISKLLEPGTGRFIGYQTSNGYTIYLDGRPRPSPNAPHTWFGFSVGAYEGNVLKFTTTHIKDGVMRRLGVPYSDKTTLTSYWIRHGDVFTWITIHEDPVYLTEPMIRSMSYYLNPAVGGAGPGYGGGAGCTVVEEVERPAMSIPHMLPGANTYLNEYGTKYDLPMEVMMGGAATMGPDVARKLIEAANAKGAKPRVLPREEQK